MRKVINRVYRFLIIVGILAILVFVAGLLNNHGDPLMEDYHNLASDHRLVSITPLEAKKLTEGDETYILVMGFKQCPWCQQLLPVLDTVAKRSDIKTVYYLDILEMRDNENSPYHEIYQDLKSFSRLALDKDNDRINAPTVLFVKNKLIRAYHIDTLVDHQLNDSMVLPKLTVEQTSRLEGILLEKVAKIK